MLSMMKDDNFNLKENWACKYYKMIYLSEMSKNYICRSWISIRENGRKICKPEWFGAELSGKITNNKMAHCSRNEIDKILNNY